MGLKTDAEIAAVVVVLGVIVFAYYRDKIEAVLTHPVREVTDYVGTQVQDAGEILGIPRTNETECQKAIREGRTWDASFACPAGTWLGSLF